MTGEEMRSALAALGEALAAERVSAKAWLVGGAVMVLAFQSRDASDDLDASVYPAEEVLRAAREIGERLGLGPDWLSDAAKVYIPVALEPEWQPLGRFGALEVFRADEATMLAMKLRASRGRRDQPDIEYLVGRCGLRTEDDVHQLYQDYFPEDPLPARARPLIRQALAGAARSG